MKTLTMIAWFIIKTHGIEDGTHNYYLLEPYKNYHVSISDLKEPLPHKENHWIKLKVTMDCEFVKTVEEIDTGLMIVQYLKNNYFCDAKEFEIEKCTDRNSFIVDGVRYC